jgi:hypothetical protein
MVHVGLDTGMRVMVVMFMIDEVDIGVRVVLVIIDVSVSVIVVGGDCYR